MRREGHSMSCAWAEARFSAAFDETLDPADRPSFDRHLESCESCRRGFRELEEATRALRACAPPAVSRTFIDSVLQAVAPAGGARTTLRAAPRSWPGLLAWSTAAAALVVAGWALLTRPDPVRVEVPVVREVAVERAVPVAIPVRGAGLVLARGGESRSLAHGETVLLRPGDRLLSVEPAAPVRLEISARPLADALSAWLEDLRRERRRRRARNDARELAAALAAAVDRMTDSARYLAEAAATAPVRSPPPAVVATNRRPSPSDPNQRTGAPRVTLVPKANEVLVLETSGAASEVIPELIGLVDDEDARVAALARARLEEIQERLTRVHGIRAPVDPAGPGEGEDSNDGIGRWFGAPSSRAADPSPGEQWRSWWDENREPIRRVTHARTE